MTVVDPTKYAKALPLICETVRETFGADEDWLDGLGEVLKGMHAGALSDPWDAEWAPYLSVFLVEARMGRVDPFVPAPHTDGLRQEAAHYVQPDLFDAAAARQADAERALIDQLIAATRLYETGDAIRQLFDFTIRLRAFAPFNAMLLHIQKPGLTHAASAYDWLTRFGRAPKLGARPLLILRTKGPVDFVFDVLDTEGADLPEGAFCFPTYGALSQARFDAMLKVVAKERIVLAPLDAGDASAGWIRRIGKSQAKTGKHVYQLAYNVNHPIPTRFVTLAHELAHLYLGHLGEDPGRRVPDRARTPHELQEVEAEMAAYLVAKRNGLTPRSESYLADYKGALRDLDLYAITRAANAVETAMGVSSATLWNAAGPAPAPAKLRTARPTSSRNGATRREP